MFRRDLFCTVPNISPHSTDVRTTRLGGLELREEVEVHAYILNLAYPCPNPEFVLPSTFAKIEVRNSL